MSATEELVAALGRYAGGQSVGGHRAGGCALDCGAAAGRLEARGRPQPPRRARKAPRTHLHAELVRRRRDPAPSPKVAVQEALAALALGRDGDGAGAVEALLARDGEEPVPCDWQRRYKTRAMDYWDHFYVEKSVNFFKDRHYLREEFAELMPEEVLSDPRRWIAPLSVASQAAEEEPPPQALDVADLTARLAGRTVVLEVGCAVGNGILPLLRANDNLFGLACDLSPTAVELLRQKEEYRCGRCVAFASDITCAADGQPTPEHQAVESVVPPESADFATLLFVLSAIDPALHRAVIARLRSRLRPGGMVLFRDYGRGDLAQLRFGPGHWLGGDLYVRADGTLAAFFTLETLRGEFEAEGFDVVECEYRRREIVNRGTGVVMPRVWVQGKFRRRA